VTKDEDKRTIISDVKCETKTPVASPISLTLSTVSDRMTNLQVSAKPKTITIVMVLQISDNLKLYANIW
jgi:hypothetical protein